MIRFIEENQIIKNDKLINMKKIITNIAKNHDKIRNFIAIILYKLNLLPKEFEGRVRSIYLTKKYNKQFKKLSLNYDKAGFYSLNPMPSEDFLKNIIKIPTGQAEQTKIIQSG